MHHYSLPHLHHVLSYCFISTTHKERSEMALPGFAQIVGYFVVFITFQIKLKMVLWLFFLKTLINWDVLYSCSRTCIGEFHRDKNETKSGIN